MNRSWKRGEIVDQKQRIRLNRISKTSIRVTVFHGFMIGGESYESDDGLYIPRVGK